MKTKNIYVLISVLLVTGCVLTEKREREAPNIGSVYNISTTNSSTKIIKLSDELSSTVYRVLEREVPENALAKQPHTMGDIISGNIICENEYVDGMVSTTKQKCRITVDITDRGTGG
jgi:hypothetical protein